MADEPRPYELEKVGYTEPYRLEFYAYERMGGSPGAAEELRVLHERLKQKTDVDKYRSDHAVPYTEPGARGYTVLPVLQDLWGLPLSDLVAAHLPALRPSAVRVSGGVITCDGYPWRVTIYVDADDVVERIQQEVAVGYGCGADVGECLRAAKEGRAPVASSGVIGHTKGLERINFD